MLKVFPVLKSVPDLLVSKMYLFLPTKTCPDCFAIRLILKSKIFFLKKLYILYILYPVNTMLVLEIGYLF